MLGAMICLSLIVVVGYVGLAGYAAGGERPAPAVCEPGTPAPPPRARCLHPAAA